MYGLKWRILIVVCLFFILSPVVYAFDKERGEEIILSSRANYTFIRVVSLGRAIVLIRDNKGQLIEKEAIYQLEGSGFVIADGRLITNRHVVYPEKTEAILEPGYRRIVPVQRILSQTILVSPYSTSDGFMGAVPVSVLYESEKYDVAVLSYESDYSYLQPIQYSVVDTWVYDSKATLVSKLEIGDKIAVIKRRRDGSMFTDEVEIKYGTVVKDSPQADTEELPWFNLEDFTMEIDTGSGDSGSVVIAWKDGEPVVIGLFRASRSMGFGFFKSVDPAGYRYGIRIDRAEFHSSVKSVQK